MKSKFGVLSIILCLFFFIGCKEDDHIKFPLIIMEEVMRYIFGGIINTPDPCVAYCYFVIVIEYLDVLSIDGEDTIPGGIECFLDEG